MNLLLHIYENDEGVTCFDRYFKYLKSIEKEMPQALAGFAMDPGRYELRGPRTLHDAWLMSLNVNKAYASEAGSTVNTAVALGLLSAAQDSSIELHYCDVEEFRSSLSPDRWPDRPVDLLTHEITKVGDGLFRHHLQFDRSAWVQVSFRQFSFSCVER